MPITATIQEVETGKSKASLGKVSEIVLKTNYKQKRTGHVAQDIHTRCGTIFTKIHTQKN
jgi:hypothetical protein